MRSESIKNCRMKVHGIENYFQSKILYPVEKMGTNNEVIEISSGNNSDSSIDVECKCMHRIKQKISYVKIFFSHSHR